MKKKKIVILFCLLAFVCGCQSVSTSRVQQEISVTLHQPVVHRMISDVSQRDSPPSRSVRQNHDGSFTKTDLTEKEIENWKKTYTAQVDLIVKVTNISTRELKLFEEWNSWGYSNLKFVFGDDGFHECWVTKQPGLWYRNFSSSHTLAIGESLEIPVAFADHIWSGLEQIRANTNQISYVRALYEQYQAPMFGRDGKLWRGSVSSSFYSANDLLPRLGFYPSEWMPDQENELIPEDATPPNFSDPDDVKINIKYGNES